MRLTKHRTLNHFLCDLVFVSTFLRVLAFSPYGVKSVRVWLDGRPLPPATGDQEGPLYTTPWDPSRLASGLHSITVVVEVKYLSSTAAGVFTHRMFWLELCL